MYHSENFRKCSVCVRFDFVSCRLLSKSLHTLLKRQRQILHCYHTSGAKFAVDYAWWQKQDSLLICSYCVSFTFAWGYCTLLLKHFCLYVQCLTVAGVSQPSPNVPREIRNSQEPQSY